MFFNDNSSIAVSLFGYSGVFEQKIDFIFLRVEQSVVAGSEKFFF